jgi:isoquinoline 1-oxidoreductase
MARRTFLKVLGGGIIISFVPAFPDQVSEALAASGRQLPTDFNAFLRIDENGRVSCFTGKGNRSEGVLIHSPRRWRFGVA